MRGHVQKVDEGTFRVYVDAGRDPITGRRRRLTKTVHGSQREADEVAAKLILEASEGHVPTNAMTVGVLLDRWLEHATPNLAPWTLIGYKSKIETHIRPALGDIKLEKLTTARLDLFYREILKKGRVKNGKRAPLSAQSVMHVHAIIRRACEQALKWGWLDRNPAKLAEPPSIEKQERDLPTSTEILSIAKKLTTDMRELVWLAIITGARRGELCGMRWTDITFKTVLIEDEPVKLAEVMIRRSIADTPQGIVVKATKTRKDRPVPLDALTTELLAQRYVGMVDKARACKVKLAKDAYVFSDIPGGTEPLRPALVSKRWANAARAAKVKCRFHDIRHFTISELLEAGFEVGSVSKRVGHASIVMTHDRYQHVRGTSDLAASEHLAALLQPQ